MNFRDRLFEGGLHMHYQPVIDLHSGELHLLEALARLRLEDGTIALPGAFLPQLAEGDINRLFRESLDQTLKQLAAWDSLGHQLRASINIHPTTLMQQECPIWVAEALHRHNIAPYRLVLELLEDYVEDHQAKQQVFDELIALGVGMAQDDLGAGHSHIGRLTALAFSTVKIDRKVTAQLSTSPIPTMTFLATLATMGQNMGWNVVVEGLEDAGLVEAATIIGIPYGQGYDIARPMPPGQVLQWISTQRPRDPHTRIQTPVGALAFHWQFARLASPHPGSHENCPLTVFLATYDPAGHAKEWHYEQHAPSETRHQASTKLLNWLTDKAIKDQRVTTSAGGTNSHPEFFVLQLDQ